MTPRQKLLRSQVHRGERNLATDSDLVMCWANVSHGLIYKSGWPKRTLERNGVNEQRCHMKYLASKYCLQAELTWKWIWIENSEVLLGRKVKIVIAFEQPLWREFEFVSNISNMCFDIKIASLGEIQCRESLQSSLFLNSYLMPTC